jgi:hypothetical protein
MPITALTLAVVGADFPNKRGPTRRFAISLCRHGDPVQLAPEPKNPADPRAVQVQDPAGIVMGYITAERCGWIGSMIASGRDLRAVFQEATTFGCLIRVSLDGNDPDLPPAHDAPNQETDWWPDDVPPDE